MTRHEDTLSRWALSVKTDALLPLDVDSDAAWDAQMHGLRAVRAIREDAHYFACDGPCVADFAISEARRAIGAALAAVGLGRNL